jgi:hypothetical protein
VSSMRVLQVTGEKNYLPWPRSPKKSKAMHQEFAVLRSAATVMGEEEEASINNCQGEMNWRQPENGGNRETCQPWVEYKREG